MKKNLDFIKGDITFEALEDALKKEVYGPESDKKFDFFSSLYSTQCFIPELGMVKAENKRVGKDFIFQTLYFDPIKDVCVDVTPVKFNVGFSFYLKGRADCYLVNLDTWLPMIPGTGIICVSNYGRSVLKLKKGEPFLNVTLFIKSKDFMTFMGDSLPTLPDEFLTSLKDPDEYYGIGGPTDQRIKDLLDRVQSEHYKGPTETFFLESAAMEVMGTQIARLIYDQKAAPQENAKIELAGNIIKNTLANPPTIKELAIQVGLNEHKLKRAFKASFGTTIHKYLVDCRMEQAMYLLIKKRYSVKETAFAIGYSNPNAFSNAFYKHIGYWPTDFVKQKLVYE